MKLKKSSVWLLAAMLGFASCSGDKETTYDELGISPLVAGPVIVYADQTTDTFTIVSVSSWKAEVEGEGVSLDPFNSSKSQSGTKVESHNCPIFFTANTTGNVRSSLLKVSNERHTVGRSYLQTYWLNITLPTVAFTGTTSDNSYQGAYFSKEVAKDSVSTQLMFTIYAPEATLTTDAEWITPKEQHFSKGLHTVKLDFSANEGKEDRKAVYTLTTSNGISNDITVIQKH